MILLIDNYDSFSYNSYGIQRPFVFPYLPAHRGTNVHHMGKPLNGHIFRELDDMVQLVTKGTPADIPSLSIESEFRPLFGEKEYFRIITLSNNIRSTSLKFSSSCASSVNPGSPYLI